MFRQWWDQLTLWWAYQNGKAVRCTRCRRLTDNFFAGFTGQWRPQIKWYYTCMKCVGTVANHVRNSYAEAPEEPARPLRPAQPQGPAGGDTHEAEAG